MKKALLNIVNAVSVIIIILATVILLTVVMTSSGEAPSFLGYSVLRIVTGSMEPEIPTDSLILVKIADADEIVTGDVISFYSLDPELDGMINTHRVCSVEEDAGGKYFVTKGDANAVADEYTVPAGNLVGKVVYHSKGLGVFVNLLSNPVIFLPFIILPLLALLVSNLVKSVKTAKEIAKEEEEAALREMQEALELRRRNAEAKKALEEAERAEAGNFEDEKEAEP